MQINNLKRNFAYYIHLTLKFHKGTKIDSELHYS